MAWTRRRTVDWFDGGGTLPMEDMLRVDELLSRASRVPGLLDSTRFFGVGDREPAPLRASAVEFILEGLAATKRISRSDERGYQAAETAGAQKRARAAKSRRWTTCRRCRGDEEVLQLTMH